MSYRRKFFEIFADRAIGLLSLNTPSKLSSAFVERIAPTYVVRKGGEDLLRFHCPNELTRWRYETFFSKEPETIEWIDGFSRGDTLFDIGANVGLYSLYAARSGCRVLAFEPEALNHALINRNVHLNNLSDSVMALNVALSDKDGIDYLYIPKFDSGQALNNFGEAKDWRHEDFRADFKQAVISFTIDSFVKRFPEFFPNHIKVDVDGLEASILNAGKNTLKDERVKSLLVEINEGLEEDMKVVSLVRSCGLNFKLKRHAPMFDTGEFSRVFNYVFAR